MTYEEFNEISKKKVDYNMYDREIEPVYMEFESLTKKEVSALFWGDKKGYYNLWLQATSMLQEKRCLDKFIYELERLGLNAEAECYFRVYESRKEELERKIKNLRIK